LNLDYFIARKVAASGQQSFSRLIIRIAIVAVALSVSVMIIATSLIRGFKNEISSKIFGFWGHIHIMDTGVNNSMEAYPVDVDQVFYPYLDTVSKVTYFDNPTFLGYTFYDRMAQFETKGGINHIQVFATLPGVIRSKDDIEGIILKGIGRDYNWENLKEYLKEGKELTLGDSISRDILISRQTANRLNLEVGERLIVHFIKNKEQLQKRFTVCGIYKTGLEEYDQKFAIVDIRILQELLDWNENQVGGFEVFIDNIDDLNAINEHIYIEKIPNDLYSQTIRDKSPSIFEWLELQDINEIVILALMIIVSIINMVTALMILILERTNMIGTLKALGYTNWGIRKIFLYYAAYIICIGLFWGNLIGISICFTQDYFEVIKLSEADYYLSVAPIEFNWFSILALNLGTLFITLIFLIIPSYLVTRISPVKAIRFK
jgi:lipoprotein-releasing system permease protein